MEFKRTTRGSGGQPDLAPMIDVVFHLLIFFMAFSVLYQTTMSIDVELPKAVRVTSVLIGSKLHQRRAFSVNRKIVEGGP